jgi:hypothetical protein
VREKVKMDEKKIHNNTIEKRYESSHIDRGYKLALLGLNNSDLATAFGVAPSTITDWMQTRPEFKAAIESGRTIADTKVAASLYQRALGYDRTATKHATHMGKFMDSVEVIEHVPADVGAAQFWLKNRQKALWTDRSELEMMGDTGIVVNFNIPRPSVKDLQLERDRNKGLLPDADD